MKTFLNRAYMKSRYLIRGRLVLETALHIGTGRDSATVTDSPIIRDGLGRPVIPGSSIKGAFRSAVERLVPNLPGYRTCQLMKDNPICLSTNQILNKAYGVVSQAAARRQKLAVKGDGQAQLENEQLAVLGRTDWAGQEMTEVHLLDLLAEHLCDTCQTFGSVHLASVVNFYDLAVIEPWAETTQVRDGVGIDRDSECAVPQIKFDYEVVPAQTGFDFRLSLENPSRRDLALIALGLHELAEGMIPLGGIRSRGLGRCRLVETTAEWVDFTVPEQFARYLSAKQMNSIEFDEFLQAQLAELMKGEGHA